jgi:hypothetical protein
MARTGLSKEDVKLASAQLKAQGRYPSVDAVRAALGDTGSKSTIHKYLKELESDAGTVSERQVRTARSLQSFTEELAAQLHAEADQRIVELQAQHASVVATMGVEITALQAKVRALEAAQRSAVLTHEPSFDKPHAAAPRPSGFGAFGSMVNNSRSGKQVWSKFSELFGSRSRADDDTAVPAERFTLPLHS